MALFLFCVNLHMKEDLGNAVSAESSVSGSRKVTKDDIIIANSADIKSVDPTGQSDDPSAVIIRHMYNGPTMTEDDGAAVGDREKGLRWWMTKPIVSKHFKQPGYDDCL